MQGVQRSTSVAGAIGGVASAVPPTAGAERLPRFRCPTPIGAGAIAGAERDRAVSPSLSTSMDDSLYFTEHHHQVRETVREFSRSHIAPVAAELDRTSTFPWENIKAMGELGLLGVPWSDAMGGAGMDQLSYYITIHEMAKVDASHALTISAHTNLGTSPIVEFGTEEQRRRYVPLLASGRVMGGFGLTEPGSGSDAGSTASTALDKGDHYLLNGSKIF